MTRKEFERESGRYLSALPALRKSENTERAYRRAIEDFKSFLNKGNVADTEQITPLIIEEWRASLFRRGVSDNSTRQYMGNLRTFFVWAERVGLTENGASPIKDGAFPQRKTVEYELLTREELRRVLSETPRGMNRKTIDRNRAIIVLLVQTGLRNSELRALTLSDLDFNGGTLTVRHGKGDKARTVPFPQKSREAVRRYLESGTRPKSVKKTALLFGTDADEFGHTTNGAEWHELSTVALNAIVKSYVKRITGKVIHCHTLRHMACSLWDDLGVSMRDAQQALGHASIAMTERVYTHVLNKGKAAKSINNAFACANM